MKDNSRIASIRNGKTLGPASPKKETPKGPVRINEGKGLGKASPTKK